MSYERVLMTEPVIRSYWQSDVRRRAVEGSDANAKTRSWARSALERLQWKSKHSPFQISAWSGSVLAS